MASDLQWPGTVCSWQTLLNCMDSWIRDLQTWEKTECVVRLALSERAGLRCGFEDNRQLVQPGTQKNKKTTPTQISLSGWEKIR